MRKQTSRRVALCGVLAAMMIVVMLLGTIIPLSTYACPALAGVISIPVIWEFGAPTGGLLYAAVSILSLLLTPDKEAALLFALLLGWYPILRPKLQHLRQRPLRIILKLVIFNLAICLVYALLLFVFTSPDLQAEAAGYTLPLLMGTLVLGNVTFFVYDLLLARVSNLYVYRLRPKLFSSHF